ncbi:hypothetical protein DF268_13915 [Streptomyces sp. V2]|nr:hypothetical protein DF268_13915 [Streptomyces sp. V2]
MLVALYGAGVEVEVEVEGLRGGVEGRGEADVGVNGLCGGAGVEGLCGGVEGRCEAEVGVNGLRGGAGVNGMRSGVEAEGLRGGVERRGEVEVGVKDLRGGAEVEGLRGAVVLRFAGEGPWGASAGWLALGAGMPGVPGGWCGGQGSAGWCVPGWGVGWARGRLGPIAGLGRAGRPVWAACRRTPLAGWRGCGVARCSTSLRRPGVLKMGFM